MSGFEVAGIVLAVIPLVSDVQPKELPFFHAVRAKQERREFAEQLMHVQTRLRYALVRVFFLSEADLTETQRQALLNDRIKGSEFLEIWREIREKNPGMIKMNMFAQFEFVLQKICELLKEVVQDSAIPRDAGSDILMGIETTIKRMIHSALLIRKGFLEDLCLREKIESAVI